MKVGSWGLGIGKREEGRSKGRNSECVGWGWDVCLGDADFIMCSPSMIVVEDTEIKRY